MTAQSFFEIMGREEKELDLFLADYFSQEQVASMDLSQKRLAVVSITNQSELDGGSMACIKYQGVICCEEPAYAHCIYLDRCECAT